MTRLVGSREIFGRLSLGVAAATILFVSPVHALTCLFDPASLEESYALAEGIVVGQVLGCADDTIPTSGRCPDDRYHIETIEVLKEPKPWRSFSGGYRGADGMTRCGQAFRLGESYLLFFDETGAIIADAGGALKGPYPQTREIQQTLAVLREYRDGRAADLSDPWIFTDMGLTCELKQRVARYEISFTYTYADSSDEYAYGIEYDDDGNPTLVNPRLVSQVAQVTYEADGPQVPRGSLMFNVFFPQYPATERDTATVSIGDRTWNLSTLTYSLLQDGRALSSQSSELTFGDSAEQIFDAMLGATTATIRKRGKEQTTAGVTRQTPTAFDEPEDMVFETRTRRFAEVAGVFEECVDGTRRAPGMSPAQSR